MQVLKLKGTPDGFMTRRFQDEALERDYEALLLEATRNLLAAQEDDSLDMIAAIGIRVEIDFHAIKSCPPTDPDVQDAFASAVKAREKRRAEAAVQACNTAAAHIRAATTPEAKVAGQSEEIYKKGYDRPTQGAD